ncbi:MAG: FtsX-like permease family protein, partial [Sphaerochaetaceae bacterium]|nr:FtsX-like permease family protein [Sphaerochaetaceae bacterium]
SAIIMILSVMNSLQHDLLENLKSIESFHVHVSNVTGLTPKTAAESLSKLDNVSSVFPFAETRMIIRNESSAISSTGRVRGIPPQLFTTDNPFSRNINISQDEDFTAVPGYSLYKYLDARKGEIINIDYLGKGRTLSLTLKELSVPVSGVYQSPISEFNRSTVFVPFDSLIDGLGEENVIYGLFLEDDSIRSIEKLTEEVKSMYPESTIESWQEIHGPFYSALLLEKILMYVFLSFMFIIIILNLKNSTIRLINAKRRELAILRSVGATRRSVHLMILGSTAIISSLGVVIGTVLGIAAGSELQSIFSFFNDIYFSFTGRYHVILSYPISGHIAEGQIFLIDVLVIAFTSVFTFLGSRRLLKKEPMEILWHE